MRNSFVRNSFVVSLKGAKSSEGSSMNGSNYGYDYDKAPGGCKGAWTNRAAGLPRRGEGAMRRARINIGNRRFAIEGEEYSLYESNALNQYTEITENETPFTPAFDADGIQIRIKTATGIWTATYNALNRPVSYTRENEDGTRTVITADYDYMGRRVFKKAETVYSPGGKIRILAAEGFSSASRVFKSITIKGGAEFCCCKEGTYKFIKSTSEAETRQYGIKFSYIGPSDFARLKRFPTDFRDTAVRAIRGLKDAACK